MRIYQLLSGIDVIVTNEENDFLRRFSTMPHLNLYSLADHDRRIVQSLVSKDLYEVAEDNITFIRKFDV